MATHGLRIAYAARSQTAVLALCAGVMALIAALLATRCCDEFLGPRGAHMVAHILVMNAIAPFAAWGVLPLSLQLHVNANRALVAGFTFQIALFFVWHLPGAATSVALAHGALNAALLCASILFWVAIFSLEPVQRWRGFVALMLTGKLACLLGALLLFAPRLLDGGAADTALDDQRMAGLLMLAACPLCYLASAIAIAAKWLRDIEAAAPRIRTPIVGSS